jgi:hypothetical protein
MKILFATLDAGGNVPPFLGLGFELTRRGHHLERLNSVREGLGLWPVKSAADWWSRSSILVASTPALDEPTTPGLTAKLNYVGPIFEPLEEDDSQLWDFSSNSKHSQSHT